ncbi:lipid-A-disaccharide synthase [uncultured Candidatus Kuenenia sp.]|uniref:lipid-A-disaccharide synthase n=1 Tax=uncultured Candidatus Kuenenia sp. TaxID=1048336 RepID=UPI0025DFC3C7|nr:lipid-A-disaccharide synthase [uncultured Candidatus Kuenenia sp.]
MNNYKIFISAGESSGDIHGANLMRSLLKKNPNITFYGLGKERMNEAGLHCLCDMKTKSLMWLHALTELSAFLRMKKDCVRFFQHETPCAVILIDYCGFNFQLARAAKKLKIPVIYYITPQLWAHGPWRIKKLRKLVDFLIVIYPFEKSFYETSGLPVTYVGHPLFDELDRERRINNHLSMEEKQVGEYIVSLLPGSRKQEIIRLLPLLLRAAKQIKQTIPSIKILVSCTSEQYFSLIRLIVEASHLPAEIIVGCVRKIIQSSDICLAGSGTVTLQIAYYHTPMLIVYKISPFAYFIARPFLTTPYIGLVNILANKMIVPETLMCSNNYSRLANQAIELLRNNQKRHLCIENLRSLMDDIGKLGASERAAEEIFRFLRQETQPVIVKSETNSNDKMI